MEVASNADLVHLELVGPEDSVDPPRVSSCGGLKLSMNEVSNLLPG